VKNKAGDLSDLNNYKAIAPSPVLSKLFEGVLAKFLGSDSTVQDGPKIDTFLYAL